MSCGSSSVVLLLCIGGAWAVSLSVGFHPDEGFQLSSIWCSTTAGSSGCVRTGTSAGTGIEYVDVLFPLARRSAACYIVAAETSAACQTDAPVAQVSTRSPANDGLYPGGSTT